MMTQLFEASVWRGFTESETTNRLKPESFSHVLTDCDLQISMGTVEDGVLAIKFDVETPESLIRASVHPLGSVV